MKTRTLFVALVLLGLLGFFGLLRNLKGNAVAPRTIKLMITGPGGQRFSGSWVADGVTNTIHAVAPTSLSTLAREVTYEFKREGGEGEFRVGLYVNELCRISTTSAERPGVRGALRYGPDRENCWAAPS